MGRGAVAVDGSRLFKKRNPFHLRPGRSTRVDRGTDHGVERRSRERDDIVLVVLVVDSGNPGWIGWVRESEGCHEDDGAEQQDHEEDSSYHPRRRYLMMVHKGKRIRRARSEETCQTAACYTAPAYGTRGQFTIVNDR